jgi:hypothetical protein
MEAKTRAQMLKKKERFPAMCASGRKRTFANVGKTQDAHALWRA